MAIVDAQGRLFGRLNLLDAVLLVLVAGLIPLGLAAYSLFRERPPRIVSVAPAHVAEAEEVRFTIKGENLRPYLRVSAGPHQALDFIFRSTTEADIPFMNLPAGEYDVILYDHAQERSRLAKALTVGPGALPPTQMIAVGAFGNLTAETAAQITAGLSLSGNGEVIRTGRPAPDRTLVFAGQARVGVQVPNALRVPAVVRLRCGVRSIRGRPECVIGGAALAPTVLLVLPTPFGGIPFIVDQVRSTEPVQTVQIRVRFNADLVILSLVRPGDADRGNTPNELATGAVVVGMSPIRRINDTVGDLEATLRADVQATPTGWLYDSLPLQAGGKFSLRTARFVLHGVVTALPPPATDKTASQ